MNKKEFQNWMIAIGIGFMAIAALLGIMGIESVATFLFWASVLTVLLGILLPTGETK